LPTILRARIYSPPVTDPVSQLVRVPESAQAGPNEATCWRAGSAPGRTLPNLRGIPTMVMVSQSSFAAQTQVWLKGNGHLMNVELNSDQIAQFLIDWL
jgi:hypothetical protein